MKFTNALVSVSDKTGIVDFLRPLAHGGMRIVSTGGTAKLLKENGIKVIDIQDQTGFPEVMDGRVKTLHPKVHMSLLARTYKDDDMAILKEENLAPFDLVIGNLYPFEEASKKNSNDMELSEYIDIGGPSFLRASAKNYNSIAVLCDPSDYSWVADKKDISLLDRKKLAAKVFCLTSNYDAKIANQLVTEKIKQGELEGFNVSGHPKMSLRYGENPQQNAHWFTSGESNDGLHQAEILQGKPLSYNNILDLDAAVKTLKSFDKDCVVSLKHNNPCGVAISKSGESTDAEKLNILRRSLKADPVSVFGGIIALNFSITVDMAVELSEMFLECIIAPELTSEAKSVFSKKKNLRVLQWEGLGKGKSKLSAVETCFRSIEGGFLVQDPDEILLWNDQWSVTGDQPSEEVKRAIEISWKVCANLKSNAIAIANSEHSIGLGMGQVNRVDAVEQAINRAKNFHEITEDTVLSSDAFFPFADSIELIAAAGIKWVVQPGGSIKDEEVISRAKELGVNMVLTGRRHFKH